MDNDPKKLIYQTDSGESFNIVGQLETSSKEQQTVELTSTSINFSSKHREDDDAIEEENTARDYPISIDEGKISQLWSSSFLTVLIILIRSFKRLIHQRHHND